MDVLWWRFFTFHGGKKKKCPLLQFCKTSGWRMERAAYLGLLLFDWGEDVQRAAALIFTTSSHFFSWCQKHCESVSHSYAAPDGPIPLLQLSGWRDSWGPVSWFRASFIFLLANNTEAFLGKKKTPRRRRPRRARDPPTEKKILQTFAGPETGHALKVKVYVSMYVLAFSALIKGLTVWSFVFCFFSPLHTSICGCFILKVVEPDEKVKPNDCWKKSHLWLVTSKRSTH